MGGITDTCDLTPPINQASALGTQTVSQSVDPPKTVNKQRHQTPSSGGGYRVQSAWRKTSLGAF